jgi:hypothetical protein
VTIVLAYACRVRCLLAIPFLVAIGSTTARADATVTINLNSEGQSVADEIGLSLPDFEAQSEQKIDALFRLADLPHLLTEMVDTAGFAARDFGVDYAVDPGDVAIGFVADGAIASDESLTSSTHALSATMIDYGGTADVNLAHWSLPRWTVSASGAYAATTIRGLAGHLISADAHVQYQVVAPPARSRARWTGVTLTSGLEYARLSIGLESTLGNHVDVVGTTGHKSVHLASTGTLSVLATSFTVPIEATTGVRLLGALDLYGGGGVDLSHGSSTITLSLDSVLSIDTVQTPIGTAHISASGDAKGTPLGVHGLAGLAIHTAHARVFVQGELAPSDRSLAIGMRGVF